MRLDEDDIEMYFYLVDVDEIVVHISKEIVNIILVLEILNQSFKKYYYLIFFNI